MDLQKLETSSTRASSERPERTERADPEFKAYTFRNVSATLHKAWKTCAALTGISMEEFALTAIQERIEIITKQRQAASSVAASVSKEQAVST